MPNDGTNGGKSYGRKVAAGRLTPHGYRPRLIEERLDALMRGLRLRDNRARVMVAAENMDGALAFCERDKAGSSGRTRCGGGRPDACAVGRPSSPRRRMTRRVCEVWDAARRFVDETSNERGLLLLTGSTALKKADRGSVRHSGAGRIARLAMRPMSLVELGKSTGEVSLKALLEGRGLTPLRSGPEVADVARWCCRGGWPPRNWPSTMRAPMKPPVSISRSGPRCEHCH